MSIGFLLPAGAGEYQAALEEFPAYGSVLLRLAFVNLRTVIVTAAVYRGFNQELAPHHLTFRHRAGVTPYTSTHTCLQSAVFLLNSRSHRFFATPSAFVCTTSTYQGTPSSEVTVAICRVPSPEFSQAP